MADILWFRFHWQFLHNKKVQTLPLDQFKILINTMCYACKVGNVPWNVSETLYDLREDGNEIGVSFAFHEFVRREILVTDAETFPETFHFKNWNEYQYKSDSSTDRVKRHRKKMEREMKRFRNVSETAQRAETETDINSLSSALRAERIDEKIYFLEWLGVCEKEAKIPAEWKTYCAEEMGWSEQQIKKTWGNFLTYHGSKDAKKKTDWHAAWRLWCGNERVTTDSAPAAASGRQPARPKHTPYLQPGAGSRIKAQMEANAKRMLERKK